MLYILNLPETVEVQDLKVLSVPLALQVRMAKMDRTVLKVLPALRVRRVLLEQLALRVQLVLWVHKEFKVRRVRVVV
jgi:hypothetical protein